MIDFYIENKKHRDMIENQNNMIIFGLISGLMLMLVAVLNWLSAEGFWSAFCVFIFIVGFLVFAVAIVIPAALKYPYKAFRIWGNFIGKMLFMLILIPIYFLFITPVGLLQYKKRNKQGYYLWEQRPTVVHSMFIDIEQSDKKLQIENKSSSYFKILYNLLSVFVTNKKFIFIPAVIVLIVIGLIFFFISTNVVTGFIYTLF